MLNGIENFACSATQTLNGSCILGVIVGDSLRMQLWQLWVMCPLKWFIFDQVFTK
jgi:hypothetical protein